MVSSDIFDGHRVLGIEIFAVKNLKGPIIERYAYLTLRIDTDLCMSLYVLFLCSSARSPFS